jgi:hypothetical protein
MELDAGTLAAIVGVVTIGGTALAKIGEKAVDALIAVVKERRAASNPTALAGVSMSGERRTELLLRMDSMTTAVKDNTEVVKTLVIGDAAMKEELARGLLLLGKEMEHACGDLSAHAGQVRDAETRIVTEFKDGRDQVIAAVRAQQ